MPVDSSFLDGIPKDYSIRDSEETRGVRPGIVRIAAEDEIKASRMCKNLAKIMKPSGIKVSYRRNVAVKPDELLDVDYKDDVYWLIRGTLRKEVFGQVRRDELENIDFNRILSVLE